jgi:hypothetical protein
VMDPPGGNPERHPSRRQVVVHIGGTPEAKSCRRSPGHLLRTSRRRRRCAPQTGWWSGTLALSAPRRPCTRPTAPAARQRALRRGNAENHPAERR